MRIATLFTLLLAGTIAGFGQQPPETPDQTLARAHDLLDQGNSQQAVSLLQDLATKQPQLKGLQHDLGVAYYRTSKLPEAKQAFAAAIQADPTDQESIQLMGLTLYRMGQPNQAIPYLERVHGWMPNANANSNYVLGLCYLNAQRFDDARLSFAKEFEVDPASGQAYLLLASMLMRANLPELAADQAHKAAELSPNLPLAHFMLGEVYLLKSDVEHATQEFEKERQLNPGYAAVYDRLADVYTRTGKLDQAQESLTKAISLDTSSTGPFIQMGKVLLRRGDATTSLMYLRHAEKMDPSNFITHTLLAQAYRKVGQEDESKRETDLASKIHSDSQVKLQPVE